MQQRLLLRLNLQQRLGSSPEQHYDLHARLLVKEERLGSLNTEPYCHTPTAFKPYSSPGQENLPQHSNQPAKVAELIRLFQHQPTSVWEVIHH